MAPGISYDDSGSLASYFGVTVLVFILLPSTYLTFRPAKRSASSSHHSYNVKSLPAGSSKPLAPWPRHLRLAHPNATSKGSSSRKARRIGLLSLGWALLAFLCLRIANAPPITGGVVYNPFEILGLSDSSTEKQIKKHYKKLSLQLYVHLEYPWMAG